MTKKNEQLRLRVFAGPNGSGKSTVIQFVRNYKVNDVPLDFGYYINADDIACELRAVQIQNVRYLHNKQRIFLFHSSDMFDK